MNVAILGATRGMGRHLARLYAERGDRLCLLGRDSTQLARSAADLAARSGRSPPATVGCDLAAPEGFSAAVAEVFARLGRVDAFVITAGIFAVQEELEADPERVRSLLEVDLTNTIVLCEHVRTRLLEQEGGGTIAVFSSVAGDAPRKPVAIYGAAKAGLSHYLLSMDLRFRSRGIRYVCIKPGFVRTSMTAGLPEPPFAVDAPVAARKALAAIDRRVPEAYVPGIWRLVMFVIRHLPRAVMRRVGF